MRREIIFNESGLLVTLRYRMQKIQANETRFLLVDRIYFFNHIPYYIMQGKGSIEIEKLPHSKPQFNLIDLKNLDFYLQNGEHKTIDYDEQRQIESFANIANFNETFNEPRLYTKEFKQLEKELYGIESNNENITIKRY